jgi:hypothetical protein
MSCRLVAALLFSYASSAWASGGGTLTKAQGHVFVKTAGGGEAAAQVGTRLPVGTQVRTGADGEAEIQFEDGSLLKMQKGSSILLSANKRQKQKNAVLLFFGRLWSRVSPSHTSDSSYEISTANAVCGVRGTEFDTQVADDGSMRMQVTEGKVAVTGDGAVQLAEPGQQVEANEKGVGAPQDSSAQADYSGWKAEKRERLRTQGASIIKGVKGRILSQKDKIESLRAQQKAIEEKRKAAEERAKGGEEGAIDEVRQYNQQLATIADEIAALGDQADAGFGTVDHFADLLADPRFKAVGRKYIEMEAASLRRVKANLDKMVAEGTDISIEAMEKMLEDMSKGKGTLREKKGSSAKDLFGPDDMEMH